MSFTLASNMHRADPRPILSNVLVQMKEQHAYIREVEDKSPRELIATVGDEPSDRELIELVLFPYSIGTKTMIRS